jgi:hypothetical protein
MTAILTRTIDNSDIANLRGMFTALGPLNGVFSTVLSAIEKLTSFRTPKQELDKNQSLKTGS